MIDVVDDVLVCCKTPITVRAHAVTGRKRTLLLLVPIITTAAAMDCILLLDCKNLACVKRLYIVIITVTESSILYW